MSHTETDSVPADAERRPFDAEPLAATLGLKPPDRLPRLRGPEARRLATALAAALGLRGARPIERAASTALVCPQPTALVRDLDGAAGVVLRIWAGGTFHPGRAPADGGWAQFESAQLVTLEPVVAQRLSALRLAGELTDYVAPAVGSDLFVGFMDGYWWALAVRPAAHAAADPNHVLLGLDGVPRPRVDAAALRTLLNRIWTVYDTPRVFRSAAGRRPPLGSYAAAVRFLSPLSAVALVNAAVVVAADGGAGNVAVLNPVSIRDLFADRADIAPLVKVIARAEVARAVAHQLPSLTPPSGRG